MTGVSLKRVHKAFGSLEVIPALDLDIPEGEFCVFVGPSGCGKSTLLRMIAGLESLTEGEIQFGDRRVDQLEPGARPVSMVFQSYALYPHMKVRDNLAFCLQTAGWKRADIDRRIAEVAASLRIEPLLDKKPGQLSGGQRQRVAIGRAIMRKPEVFLFDEPLSNLDASLRVHMRLEISRLHRQLGKTTIYVTHDQVEAMTLADRIVVFNAGRIEQIGTPRELYQCPCNTFVARFLGAPKINLLGVTALDANGFHLAGGARPLPVGSGLARADGQIGCRPENTRLVAEGDGQLVGTIMQVEHLGGNSVVFVDHGTQEPVAVVIQGDCPLPVGAACGVALDTAQLHHFDDKGQRVS
jgi:ABC-type sugar transport system ATPase subunit